MLTIFMLQRQEVLFAAPNKSQHDDKIIVKLTVKCPETTNNLDQKALWSYSLTNNSSSCLAAAVSVWR